MIQCHQKPQAVCSFSDPELQNENFQLHVHQDALATYCSGLWCTFFTTFLYYFPQVHGNYGCINTCQFASHYTEHYRNSVNGVTNKKTSGQCNYLKVYQQSRHDLLELPITSHLHQPHDCSKCLPPCHFILVFVPPCVTAEACKRSWSFCQKCRVLNTYTPTYVALSKVTLVHGCMVYTECGPRWQQIDEASAM